MKRKSRTAGAIEAGYSVRVAWTVPQRIRVLLSDLGKTAIPPQKTFDAEGEVLEQALTKSLRIRNDAIKGLCSAVRRFRDVVGGKIPYSIGMKDDSPFVFAGLWEGWKDPATDEWSRTCTIITGEPNEFVREIHTRMPVILPEEQHQAWLSGEAGKEILVPFPADRMRAWPISSRVNSPKNDDPALIGPIEIESEQDLISGSCAEQLL